MRFRSPFAYLSQWQQWATWGHTGHIRAADMETSSLPPIWCPE